jgi:hypothetical protein
MSKCKVAPLKIFGREKPTIPLLEFMSAVLGTEMATTILRVFNANGIKVDIHFWFDNQAVLYQELRYISYFCCFEKIADIELIDYTN